MQLGEPLTECLLDPARVKSNLEDRLSLEERIKEAKWLEWVYLIFALAALYVVVSRLN